MRETDSPKGLQNHLFVVVKVLGRGPGTEDKRWCSLESGRGRQGIPGNVEVEPEWLEGPRDQEPGAGQEVMEGQSAGGGGTQGGETQGWSGQPCIF